MEELDLNVAQRTLYDIRDSKLYTIRKLADSNCWMVSNLSYALTANSTAIGSKNNRTTFEFSTGPYVASNSAYIMNWNTRINSSNYYYSWYAATAGGYKNNSSDTSADGSICPAGWRLPENYNISPSKSYGSLTDAYGWTVSGEDNAIDHAASMEKFPTSFVSGDFYRGGYLVDSGIFGLYWAATSYSDASAHLIHYGTNGTYPQYHASKTIGLTLRCIAL